MNKVFPNQITLKINKRVKTAKQRKILNKLKEDIFDKKKNPIDIFRQHKFKIINHMSQLKTTQNICYFNFRAEEINRHVHDNLVVKPKEHVIKIKGVEYYPELNIVCRKHYKKEGIHLIVNYVYKIVFINDKKFIIMDEFEGSTFTLDINLMKYFKLEYASTVHSVQGMSIEEPITIFDTNTPYVNRKFIWTALTRATDLDNVTIYEHSSEEVKALASSKVEQYFKLKVEGYKAQDKKANREYDDEDYISAPWIKEQFLTCKACPTCRKLFERSLDAHNDVKTNITADRIDNKIAHVKNNCKLVCIECNRKRSNHY